jgi:zinc/manganese transport system ATP-binding protein
MDRVVYMAAGKAASGTADEVVRSDVLSALYGQHVDVIHVHDRILVIAGRGAPHYDLDVHHDDLTVQHEEQDATRIAGV